MSWSAESAEGPRNAKVGETQSWGGGRRMSRCITLCEWMNSNANAKNCEGFYIGFLGTNELCTNQMHGILCHPSSRPSRFGV